MEPYGVGFRVYRTANETEYDFSDRPHGSATASKWRLGKDEEKKIPKKLRIQLLAVYVYESIAVLSSLIFYFIVIAD